MKVPLDDSYSIVTSSPFFFLCVSPLVPESLSLLGQLPFHVVNVVFELFASRFSFFQRMSHSIDRLVAENNLIYINDRGYVHFYDPFFSANFALTLSTRPPFDSYFHALSEKWAIEHFIETFRRIQGRQTPCASKSHILRIFRSFWTFLQSFLISYQLNSFKMIKLSIYLVFLLIKYFIFVR